MIGTHYDGYLEFYKSILDGLGIESTQNNTEQFNQLGLFKINRKRTQSNFDTKHIRAHGYVAQQKADIAKQRSEGPKYCMNLQINKIVLRGQTKKK